MRPLNEDDISTAKAVLARHTRLLDANYELSQLLKRPIGDDTLSRAFRCRGLNKPSTYLATALPDPALRSHGSMGHTAGVGVDREDVRIGYEPQATNGGDGQHHEPADPAGWAAFAKASGIGVDVRTSSEAACHVENDRGGNKPADVAHLDALLKATRRPVQFARLCDVLDMSPSKVRRLVDDARAKGYSVAVAGDEIGWEEPKPSIEECTTVLPTNGRVQRMAIISDLHAGSKYFLRKQLVDFLDMAYDWAEGHLTVVDAGDNVDGCYKHGQWELTHHGLYEQIDDLLTTVKQRPGMDIWFVDGNHCGTFWDATGYPTGVAIEEAAKARGRNDWHYVGNRGAMLKIGGARVELWHPKKGGGYALSYALQNKIRDTALGHKPDFLIAGHWHTWVALEQRGIHAIAAGTFQGAGSAFSKSLGGAPSIGGTLVSWEMTDHGTLRRVAIERVAYYEKEEPREVA